MKIVLKLKVAHQIDALDMRVVEAGFEQKQLDAADAIGVAGEHRLFEFLVDQISKSGGNAEVEVGDGMAAVEWEAPSECPAEDIQQITYVSHLLQAGLLSNPLLVIANTAYSGGLATLSINLLGINSSGRNRYMAERDARIVAMAAPCSTTALAAYGMILLDNGKPALAASEFATARAIDPGYFAALKYGAIAVTVSDPTFAVSLAEQGLRQLAANGTAPDAHMRVTYGMALASAGMTGEAQVQFLLACGNPSPSVTPEQWVRCGHKAQPEDLSALLGGKASD